MTENDFAVLKVLTEVKAGKCVDCSNFLSIAEDVTTCLCAKKQGYRTQNALKRCICHDFIPIPFCYLCFKHLMLKSFDRGAIVKVYCCSDPNCSNHQEDW